ncbi:MULTISPECIES: hypothetical protein [unclassified Lysobacter]|uniref:hypothetical protein n=1 Tax=unclassified Lysobacter TaxID=2635362 RepID=UPI001BEB8A1B|nr:MULTISPECIES: hypothetical protein [unclassified Lysobacter]MBT2748687.1 hypothetical protein [Lysobacter sp. ISL-42]MBT2751622.1 hypothetical protein [Lysobacter sp. ISL-50]MBT2775816.1 hypothetical protein [Lysobacter sp. ISL-54]MBT2782219.1 hypothetical protein [Lysobacter sp. ISL-52]
MDTFRRYGHLLRPDGTNQLQRLLPGLEADYVVPDERSFADLLDYAYSVAAEVRYYDLSGQSTGDWQALLETLLAPGSGRMRSTQELQLLLASRSDWPPHLVLFLTFLKLFQHLQDDLNELTRRHLLYYYVKQLGLQLHAPERDSVHAILELAQNAAATRLPAGTLLDAGKDGAGRPLTYALQNEIVVNAATVAQLRRRVVEEDSQHHRRVFVADGFDALEGPGGYTFGRRQLDLDVSQRFMQEAPLGFAVAAPILSLAEGERRITLRAHLRASTAEAVNTQGLTEAVTVGLSGAEGWLTPDHVVATLMANGGSGLPALDLTIDIGSAAPAIVAFDSALHGAGMISDRPVLRCLVRGASGAFDLFDRFNVERIDLAVKVIGLRGVVVQNDEIPLDADKPMPLFGSQPRIGSVFYVGSTEAFSKKLDSLTFNLEWKSPPDDLFEHYRQYFDFINNTLTDTFANNFRVTVDLLHERVFRRLLVNQTLFEPVTTDINAITANASAFNFALQGLDYREQPDLQVPDTFTASSRSGFARLVLSEPTRDDFAIFASEVPFEAFGHPVFARRYAHQAMALATWTSGQKPRLPSEPYTPVLNSLTLDYHATATVVPNDDQPAAYFVVGPHGAIRAPRVAQARLVPQLDGRAELLLGVRNLQPPGALTLYFEIDAGTATAANALATGDTTWSYLAAGDEWRPLSAGSLLMDSTLGFQSSGIIAVQVPAEATLAHQSLPSGLVWLRAAIDQSPESAARTLSIRTQAALARFEPGTAPLADFAAHLRQGLPVATIKALVQRNAAIRGITQPRASFDGRGPDSDEDYIRRASERLRHRHRAVTPWDIERLALERFPEVFKAKCLPHSDADGIARAGHTALVVVPNLRRGGVANPLEPRAAEELLARIVEYFGGLATPFLNLHVIRPVFERIRVEAKVVFTRGRDPGYYSGVLNEDLRRFLSPWAYQDGEDIQFGARIYRSEILAFIEGREYVDHLVGLRIYHTYSGSKAEGIGTMVIGEDFVIYPKPKPGLGEMRMGDDFIVGRAVEAAGTTQAHAIVVSHPQHLITAVAPGEEVCSGVTTMGIGYMTVGLDLEVGLETS